MSELISVPEPAPKHAGVEVPPLLQRFIQSIPSDANDPDRKILEMVHMFAHRHHPIESRRLSVDNRTHELWS